jgi:starvation-inducible DNA-binding protein
VEGPDFSELHKFFGKIYEDAYDALDQIAEYIRYLDEYAPGSLNALLNSVSFRTNQDTTCSTHD